VAPRGLPAGAVVAAALRRLRSARRAALQDVVVAVVPELTHGQPVVRTQRAQALAVKQPAVDQCLRARRTHSADPPHADALSFHASGDCDPALLSLSQPPALVHCVCAATVIMMRPHFFCLCRT
jgi:hypothetical protein